jgi:hypothetical protein
VGDQVQEVRGADADVPAPAPDAKVTPAGGSPPGLQTPLSLIVQVAGALSTLAGLVYVLGAAALWLRAWLVGLPADVAIEHEPRSVVVALGIRGVLFVAAYFVGLAAFIGVAYAVGCCAVRRKRLSLDEIYRDAKARASWLTPKGAWIALVDVCVLVVCSFLSWRALALAVGAISLVGASIRWLDDNKPGSLKLIGTLGLLSGAMITGLGWQVTGTVDVQSVSVEPEVAGISEALPYFGESGDVIYLGGVRRTGDRYAYTRQVIEIDRATHLLTFNPGSYHFCHSDTPPGTVLFHAVVAQKAIVQKASRPIRLSQTRVC